MSLGDDDMGAGMITGGAHSIGWAVDMMLAGKRVCRPGWNGKGMYIYHSCAIHPQGAPLDPPVEPYICMHTAAGKEQPGWLCSQADLLASDWELFTGTPA